MREESLAAHEQRLAELRALVAQIAADVGLPPDGLLATEVAALGHKLEDVRESLATLADSADTRQSCGDDLLQAKAFLDSVHKVSILVDRKMMHLQWLVVVVVCLLKELTPWA